MVVQAVAVLMIRALLELQLQVKVLMAVLVGKMVAVAAVVAKLPQVRQAAH
jgi:hypothetical protein